MVDVERIKNSNFTWDEMNSKRHKFSGTKFHNCFRAFRFTLKGKKIGNSESWNSFKNFFEDMYLSYKEGLVLCRNNKNKPFSKENCFWTTKEICDCSKENFVHITYNNETLTLKEWSVKLQQNLYGIKNRYYKHYLKGTYSIDDVLFGKKVRKKQKREENSIRIRASKLLSAYKIKDKYRGREFNIDKEWFIENILMKECFYCGHTDTLGADRIDNSIGHIESNIVPCCYICNTVRNQHFTVEEMKILGETIKQIKFKRNGE